MGNFQAWEYDQVVGIAEDEIFHTIQALMTFSYWSAIKQQVK